MNIPDDLPECVRRLIRPRLALRTERLAPTDSLVGVWGGSGTVPLPADRVPPIRERDSDYYPRHRISVDCAWLQRHGFGIRGCLSVYDIGCLRYVVLNDPERAFPDQLRDGLSLFGQEELSLPEDEVLDAYLTADERRAFEESEFAAEYFKLAGQGFPTCRGDLVAVLGGWHISWPDDPPQLPRLAELNERVDKAGGPCCLPWGETFRREPYRLLLWTLRDAEPWVEVWGDGAGELHGVGRVT